MSSDHLPWLSISVLVVAFLYSSVGHAGASGYLAVMTIFGMEQGLIKPTALGLNVFVAALATWQFYRAGYFSWSLFWPFALLSIPGAFLGGFLHLPPPMFKIVLGGVLLLSAGRFLIPKMVEKAVNPPTRPLAIGLGGGLGLLSGLTGTGGGIFLTPLLIFMRWAETKTASAVSAAFILSNSVAGLLGSVSATKSFPQCALLLAGAAILGGTAGSYLGSRYLNAPTIRRLLAVVLMIAGIKLILTS
jgi:uncharacterized membrane protein YfcA